MDLKIPKSTRTIPSADTSNDSQTPTDQCSFIAKLSAIENLLSSCNPTESSTVQLHSSQLSSSESTAHPQNGIPDFLLKFNKQADDFTLCHMCRARAHTTPPVTDTSASSFIGNGEINFDSLVSPHWSETLTQYMSATERDYQNLTCSVCGTTYSTVKYLIRHYKSMTHARNSALQRLSLQHGDVGPDSLNKSAASQLLNAGDVLYVCSLCNLEVKTKRTLMLHYNSKRHKTVVRDSGRPCPSGLETFPVPPVIDENTLRCSVCRQVIHLKL